MQPVGIVLILQFFLSLNQHLLPLSLTNGKPFCLVAPRQQHQRNLKGPEYKSTGIVTLLMRLVGKETC